MPRFHIEVDVECADLSLAEAWADALTAVADTSEVTVSEEGWLVTPNPKGEKPNGDPEGFLQVLIAHESAIDLFKDWVTSHGWVLKKMPRFDMPAHHYTPTHFITPSDAAMRAAGFPVPKED